MRNAIRLVRDLLYARLFGNRLRREIDEELSFHLEQTTEEYRASGMSLSEARDAADARFGRVETTRRACLELRHLSAPTSRRRKRGMGMFAALYRDVRYGVRNLYKSPGYSVAAILTLGLGIGANAALFSVVDGILLSPFPYRDSERLVRLWENDRLRGTQREGFSGPDFFDVVERSEAFEELAAVRTLPYTVTDRDNEPARLTGTRSSYTLFSLLGVEPAIGRSFDEKEDAPGGDPVVVLSDRLFRGRFGGDLATIGTSLDVEGTSHRVIGVMPEGFAFPETGIDLWMPLQVRAETASRGMHGFGVVGRLKDGAAIATANANLETIAKDLEREFADDNLGRGMWAQSLHDSVVGSVETPLLLLLGSVALVLLIACVNVANLQLARGSARKQEVSVRAAMGAGRGTLIRQFLTESLILTLLGGFVGVAISYASVQLLLALDPGNLPRLANVSVDPRVLAFTFVVAVASGVLFGILPSVSAARYDLQDSLRQAGRGELSRGARQGLRRVLVVSEIAMAVMLVTGAGLLIKSFWHLQSVDPGFQPEGVYSMDLQLPASRYPQERESWPNWTEVRNFQRDLVQRVQEFPSVRSASLALNTPMNAGWTTRFQIAGQPEVAPGEQEEVRIRVVSPDYFETVHIPIVEGRSLTETDDRTDAPPVLLVNEAFVRRYFDREIQEPIGSRVEMWGVSREIVGITRDVKFAGLDQASAPAVYPTFSQMPFGAFSLMVRATGSADPLAGRIRSQVRELDPDLAVSSFRALDELVQGSVAQPRFNMLLLTLFAALAMALATIGIYGVIAFGVSQRIREIGVRMSLGAAQGDVLRQFVGEGFRLSVVGVAVGLLAASLLSRVLSSLLFGVNTLDGSTFVTVGVLSMTVAVVASWMPARRASRTNPTVALRHD